MDYLGKDSFTNIWAKINETLGTTPEVKIESSAVKTPSPPEVVHSEEPKPLKSALKKTSTVIPPVESELIDSSEQSIKQLEKLDLSKDILKQIKTPDTPTVTSPTPPTTPATQTSEAVKSGPVEPVLETPKPESVESVIEESKPEPIKSVIETPKPESIKPEIETQTSESIEPIIETPKPTTTEVIPKTGTLESTASIILSEPIKQTPILDGISKEPPSSEKKLDLSVPKADDPIKETSQPIKEAENPLSTIDNSAQLESNDPPIAPKRSNKGLSNVEKTVQPSEKK